MIPVLGFFATLILGKERFGDRITFWDAMDTLHILPYESVEDVENEVKRLARILGPGGEFALASVRNIQSDVALENIIAMVEAARRYSTYPIQV
jgi:uroporphyrinogen decarboxylase